MTVKIVIKDQIRAEILKILSGYCLFERRTEFPCIYILSPWISNVQLELDAEVLKLDTLWFGLDYGIRSINLPYALLLLKLDFGADINIVTLPATESNYGDGVSRVRTLLDFLDEIGCRIYVNPTLHSKLILSNDLALVGSFNLSKSALYDREEIGISIDDIDNLKILEKYAFDVISSTPPYGCTAHVNHVNSGLATSKMTRGWLYEKIVERWSSEVSSGMRQFDEVLVEHILGAKVWYLKDVVKELALDLDAFYVKTIVQYLQSTPYLNEDKRKERFNFVGDLLGYQGRSEIGELLDFLKTRLFREHIPKIPLRATSMPQPTD